MTSIHYGKCEKCNYMGGLNNSLVCLCCVDEKNLLSRAIKKENQDLRAKLEASEDNVEELKEKTGQVIIEREVWNHQQKKLEAVTAERDYYKENYHRLYDRIDEANSENQDLRTKLEASEDNVKAFKEKTGQVTIEKEEWKSKAFKVNWDIGGIENKLKIAVEALEHIKKHQEVKASHTDSRMFKLSAIWLMTDKALEKIKGMEG